MDKQTHDIIKSVRPKLKDAFPLTAAMVRVFGYGNLLIGAGLITEQARLSDFLTINTITTSFVWGVIFAIMGAIMLYGYARNEWNMLRNVFMAAILLKSFWMVSLIIRFIDGRQDNVIVPVIWLMLLAGQVMTYVYFTATPRGKT